MPKGFVADDVGEGVAVAGRVGNGVDADVGDGDGTEDGVQAVASSRRTAVKRRTEPVCGYRVRISTSLS